jgi:hypothetical protein
MNTNMNTNTNLLMNYINYSRENQRIYRYILENTCDNDRNISNLISREIEIRNRNTRNRIYTTHRPIRQFNADRFNTDRFNTDRFNAYRFNAGRFNADGLNNLPTNTIPAFFSPVRVSPTFNQINASTTTSNYSELSQEERERYTNCSITLNNFTDDTRVMKINHCGHIFSEEGLRRHFNNSVTCPICRHDIREQDNSARLLNALRGGLEEALIDNSFNVDISNDTLIISYSLYGNYN